MKLKRILAAVLTLSTAVLAFTGCGSAKTESSAEATTVKIGVVGSIYEDLWKPAQEALKDEGINPRNRTVFRLCNSEQCLKQRRN